MNSIKCYFTLCLLLFAIGLCAQSPSFAQYYFAPQTVNPASLAVDQENMVLHAIHRQQNTPFNLNMTTTAVSFTYPIQYGSNSFGGFNFLALKDENGEGGAFKTNEIGLGYNQILKVRESQFFSFGVQSKYVNKRFSLEDYKTGTQYIPGQGFDPIIDNGETGSGFNNGLFSISTGIYWYGLTVYGERKFHLGLSVYNLNRPDESLINITSRMPIVYQAQAGYNLLETSSVNWLTEVYYSRYAGINELTVSSTLSYRLDENKKVALQGNYSTGNGIAVGVRVHTARYGVGVSYNTPSGERQQISDNVIEIGLELKQPSAEIEFDKRKRRKNRLTKQRNKRKKQAKKRRDKRKKKAQKRKKRRNKKRNKRKGKKTVTQPTPTKPTPKKVEEKVEEKAIEEVPVEKEVDEKEPVVVKEEKPNPMAEIEKEVGTEYLKETKVVHFGFDATKLSSDEEKTLTQLIALIKKYPILHVQIIGHTDKLGASKINEQVALKRAQHVADLLKAAGVPESQIEVISKGENEPLNDNATPAKRKENRRVEIKIVAKN